MKFAPMDWTGPAPDPHWTEELERIAPPSETLTWLKLVWVAGDPWQPVHRWVVYQMHPRPLIPAAVLPDLEGPNPRTFNYWDPYAPEGARFVRTRTCLVDRLQWELFRETGCYGRPLWVVQGTQGGHLRRFTNAQATVSHAAGGWKEPPPPGDLPFAEPDARTFAQLQRLDLVRAYDRAVDFRLQSPEMIEQGEEEREIIARRSLWNFLKSQQEGHWDENGHILRAIHERLPIGVSGSDRHIDYEAIERRFILEDHV